MTDTPDLDLDAALSADLDGNLDGFIADSGLSEAEVRRAIAEPGANDRRTALEAARAQLREPPAPLDDVTRRRLLTAAIRPEDASGASGPSEAPRTGRRLWSSRVAAAAVAALVLVGGGVAVLARSNRDGGTAAKSSASSDGATKLTEAIRTGDLGDLGVVDDQDIEELAGAPAAESSGAKRGKDPAPEPGSGALAADAAVPRAQVQTCQDRYRAAGELRFTGSARYQDRPVVVVGVAVGERTVVLVVAADNCTDVLYSASTAG